LLQLAIRVLGSQVRSLLLVSCAGVIKMSATVAPPAEFAVDLRLSNSQELCLDLIRICMAQFIVLGHFVNLTHNSSWLSRLPLSGLRVSIFFMLSGFLVFATTWRRKDKDFSFGDYLLERSARLWVCLVPALIFSAAVASLVIDLPDYPALRSTGPVQFFGNLLMLEDYPVFQVLRRLGLDSEYYVRPYAAAEPYWTLPIEYWLYVVFGYIFFYGYLGRGKPGWASTGLFVVAAGAVVYHGATGFGQCLSLLWLMGCLGPWAVSADRRLQQRFGYSDKVALRMLLGWLALCLLMITLRGSSRGLDFYELHVAVFLAAFLMGLIWLTGRIQIDVVPRFSKMARTIAKQTYALYLTHNAVLTFYIANHGLEFSVGEALVLLATCNVVAVPFYWFFDRHHKAVARGLRMVQGVTVQFRYRRQSVG
jgi:peptidoglycan/LPS O-acetylase OafA/YrhL